MTVGAITARTLKIDLTITEKREGSYGADSIASQQLTISLPVKGSDVAQTVAETLELLNRNVERFRGPIAFTAEARVES